MTTPLQYFMLIAKEKSIVRAAEQLYITPQNLSNHMRRLEKEYGVLFTRYPNFRLTSAGEALLETLQSIHILEEGLDRHLKELEEEQTGTITFGIHPIRARVVLPRILPLFAEQFPNVHLTFRYLNMQQNLPALKSGELDAFFGVDTPSYPDFTVLPLITEDTWMVASEELLIQKGVNLTSDMVPLDRISSFPFLLSPEDSHFRPKINLYCAEHGLVLNEIVTISDFSLQMTFASQKIGACFMPQTMLAFMEDLNRGLPAGRKLRALKAEGLDAVTNLAFVHHRLAYLTAPMKGLIRIFQKVFREEFEMA